MDRLWEDEMIGRRGGCEGRGCRGIRHGKWWDMGDEGVTEQGYGGGVRVRGES